MTYIIGQRISRELEHIAYGEAPVGYYSRGLEQQLCGDEKYNRNTRKWAYMVLARAQMHLPKDETRRNFGDALPNPKTDVWALAFDTLAHARYQLDEESANERIPC